MQSTGQTSIHASQPVQLSARTTASSLGSFFRGFPAALAIVNPLTWPANSCRGVLGSQSRHPHYTSRRELLTAGFLLRLGFLELADVLLRLVAERVPAAATAHVVRLPDVANYHR